MNHYDDLQRFKDKTRTQSLEFKDLSAQSAARERGDWAILDQLSPQTKTEATLAVGGSVSQVVPQPVSADAFVPHEVAPARVVASDMPESRAASIMQSVSTQMTPGVEPAPEDDPVVKPEPVSPAVTSQADHTPQPATRAQAPATPPEAVNYARLFAPKSTANADKAEKEEKDQPLKSLLERIASCR